MRFTIAAQRSGALITLLGVLIFSVVRDAFMLLRHPVAVGLDGYYYVIQVNELLARGRLYYPTNTPLVFYILAGVHALGVDVITSIKIGSIAFQVLLCGGVYALVTAVTRDRWLGVLGAGITAFSGLHFYMVAEFIKNSGALAMLVWSAWSAIRASQSRRLGWALLSVALLAGALLSHRSAWIIVPAIFAFAALSNWFAAGGRLRYRQIITWGIVIGLVALPWLIAAQNFIELPTWVGKELLAFPRWPVSLNNPIGKFEMIALLMLASATLLFLSYRRAVPSYYFGIVMGTVALWSLIITLNPFLVHDVRESGVVGRLGHLAYIQIAILVPGLAWSILQVYAKASSVVLAAVLLLLAASVRSILPTGLEPNFLSDREQILNDLPAQRHHLGDNPFVLARHGDEFIVTWVLGAPSQQRFPQDPKGKLVYWLLHHVRCQAITPSMIAVTAKGMDSCLVLIKHDDLSQWIREMDEAELKTIREVNPHLDNYLGPFHEPANVHPDGPVQL